MGFRNTNEREVSLAKLSNAKVANVSRIEYVYSGGDIFGETVTDFAWHSAYPGMS